MTPDEQMEAYINALLASNDARAVDNKAILACLAELTKANNALQVIVTGLVEQLAFLGALHRPDLRGHQQLN